MAQTRGKGCYCNRQILSFNLDRQNSSLSLGNEERLADVTKAREVKSGREEEVVLDVDTGSSLKWRIKLGPLPNEDRKKLNEYMTQFQIPIKEESQAGKRENLTNGSGGDQVKRGSSSEYNETKSKEKTENRKQGAKSLFTGILLFSLAFFQIMNFSNLPLFFLITGFAVYKTIKGLWHIVTAK